MSSSIRKLRKARKISQRKLAEMLNVHQTAISQWENGRTHPHTGLLPKMAQILGCTVDELLSQHIE